MTVTSTIFSLFSRSPLRPVQEHMAKVHQSVEALSPFFTHVIAKDWAIAEQFQLKIAKMESEADELKKNIKLNLPTSLFLPVNRSDLLQMLELQDRLANKAKDIAGLILGRQLSFPQEVGQPLLTYLKRCIEASAQADEAIHELDNLLETGFYGKEVKLVEKMLQTLDAIENDTDEMQIKIRHQLYTLEKDLPTIDALFMYKIIEWMGDLADRAQAVGGQLLLMLAN
jgi:predicted phosphate transport protein (TIGR00153 family)